MNSGRIRCPPANAIVIAKAARHVGATLPYARGNAGMVDLGADGDPDNRWVTSKESAISSLTPSSDYHAAS
jgi:hypothetical protein